LHGLPTNAGQELLNSMLEKDWFFRKGHAEHDNERNHGAVRGMIMQFRSSWIPTAILCYWTPIVFELL
jgi:hypothetical protein